MSRCSRAIELLNNWKEHPADCATKHDPWDEDGFSVHGLDAWDVIVLLDDIDPMFHAEAEAERDTLRAELDALRGRVAGLQRKWSGCWCGPQMAHDHDPRVQDCPQHGDGAAEHFASEISSDLRNLLDGPA